MCDNKETTASNQLDSTCGLGTCRAHVLQTWTCCSCHHGPNRTNVCGSCSHNICDYCVPYNIYNQATTGEYRNSSSFDGSEDNKSVQYSHNINTFQNSVSIYGTCVLETGHSVGVNVCNGNCGRKRHYIN